MAVTRTGTGTKRRWPLIATVAGVLLAAVVGVSVFFALRPAPAQVAKPPTPALTPTTPDPSSPAVTGGATVLADGCLGGTDPIKAIRIAHAKAPLTPSGAAELVATWARWQGQAPHDPVQYQRIGREIWAPSLPADRRKTPTQPAGAIAWVSTDQARYRVTDASKSDVTIESLFTQTVSQDGAKTQVEHVGRVTLTAISGRWAFKAIGASGPDPAQAVRRLQAEGLPYRGGC